MYYVNPKFSNFSNAFQSADYCLVLQFLTMQLLLFNKLMTLQEVETFI